MSRIEELPFRLDQWRKFAKEHGVLQTNIHHLDILDSASKIKDRQFFALRILWQRQQHLASGLELCDKSVLTEAKNFLKGMQAWKRYLKDIETSTEPLPLGVSEDLGTFSLVRYHQKRTSLSPMAHPNYQLTKDDVDSVSRKIVPSPIAHRTRSHQPNPAPSGAPETPTPMPRFEQAGKQIDMKHLGSPLSDIEDSYVDTNSRGSNDPPSPESPANAAENVPSEDEQIVNMALILFLDSVTIHHPKLQGFSSPRWTIKRLQLKFGSWEARTDGFLRLASDDTKVSAILETKPYVRAKDLHGIRKQEGAQMAAWIYQNPVNHLSGSGEGRCFRRLLISQDCFEIYLTIAEYDSAYMSYLHGDPQATFGDPSLMIMKQYGPWSTKNYEQMEHLGIVLLAFTLQQLSTDVSQRDPFIDSGKYKS